MALKYEPLVQEDLNVGTDRTWVQAPGGGKLRATQIGIHTLARNQMASEASWDPGSIAAGSYATTTLTVTDAALGDMVLASHSKMLTNDLRIEGNVCAADTVQVLIHNPTTAAITVASGTLRVVVFPFPSENPVIASFTWSKGVETDLVSFVDTSTGDIDTWLWDFDPGSSGDQNPSYNFDLSGDPMVTHDFTVTLEVSGPGGTDTATAALTISNTNAASGSGS